jgi:hypothetical protein
VDLEICKRLEIKFNPEKLHGRHIKIAIKNNPKESALLSEIKVLENKTDELIKLIRELEAMKHESVN